MALKSSMNKQKSPRKRNDSETDVQTPGTSRDTTRDQAHARERKQTPSSKIHISYPLSPHSSPPYVPRTPVLPKTNLRHGLARNLSMGPLFPTTLIPATTLYSPFQGRSLRYSAPRWSTAVGIPMQRPIYQVPYQPMPVVIAPQMLTPMCPFPCPMITPPILRPMQQPVVIEEIPSNYPYQTSTPFSPEQTVPMRVVDEIERVDMQDPAICASNREPNVDPSEVYLSLPRDLFPTARMLALDPNPIIDAFCRVDNVYNHLPWILDLELGVPKEPVSRQIATYDVKFNSVHCKNAPNAIHPGFESCSPEFKNNFTFYYDCVISSWYRGYIIMHNDKSVANFQSWLLMPMQVFGMCWP